MASSFIAEMKRRKVFRVGTMYVIGGWILLQLGDVIIEPLGFPAGLQTALIVGLAVGTVRTRASPSQRYDGRASADSIAVARVDRCELAIDTHCCNRPCSGEA